MPRTREDLERAAADAEAWPDSLDPEAAEIDDPADLRRMGAASTTLAAASTRRSTRPGTTADAGAG
jgi:hypothetical protein